LALILALFYFQQGRAQEAARLLERTWDRLDQAGKATWELALQLVRPQMRLRLEPPSVEAIRTFLDGAARRAPHDDRVWLARAHLAIRIGSYDEAARWLDDCLRRRPEDVPIWRARLAWAMATNRLAEARQAADQIPAGELATARVHALSAWLAARRGDREAEREALQQVVAADPTDFPAWDRLVVLARSDGPTDRAAMLLRRKAEIQELQARYQKLLERNQPIRDAEEMARLAEQLGQTFEARAFLVIALESDPDRDDLRRDLNRLNQASGIITSPGQTLAEVLAPELDAVHPGAR
jgi:tetratricopeptide (TPR) repeat protein